MSVSKNLAPYSGIMISLCWFEAHKSHNSIQRQVVMQGRALGTMPIQLFA